MVSCDGRLAAIDPDYVVHKIKGKFGTCATTAHNRMFGAALERLEFSGADRDAHISTVRVPPSAGR